MSFLGSSVVCSDIPAFSIPFTKEETSFFKIDNISSLSNAVDEALLYKNQKKEALYNKIQSCFTENIMLKKYKDLYLKLINSTY